MDLRWFTRIDGERVLQMDTMYGWQDVPEEIEEEERRREREADEEKQARFVRDQAALRRAQLPIHQQRALRDFAPLPDVDD